MKNKRKITDEELKKIIKSYYKSVFEFIEKISLPIDIYIKEVYKKAEKIEIEKINWEKIFKISRG